MERMSFFMTLVVVGILFLSCNIQAREPEPCILSQDHYGELLDCSNDQAALWWASSGWKVSRDRGLPVEKGTHISVSLAGNEWEAVQLVIRPNTSLQGLQARVSDLKQDSGALLSREYLELLRVDYVAIERPSDGFGCEGLWPDPLPPFDKALDLEEGINQPIWIRAHAPADATPGLYRGHIALECDSFSTRVPIQIRIYAFTLPDRMTCTTAFGFYDSLVYQYHGLEKEEDKRLVLDQYWQSFSNHRISPYNPAPGFSPSVNWVKRDGDSCSGFTEEEAQLLQEHALTPVFDWTAWDSEMERVFTRFHFNSFRFNIPGVLAEQYQGFPKGSTEYRLAFRNWGQAAQEHLREKGWLDDAYIYWVDEPTEEEYPRVMEGFAQMKDAVPGIRRMLTEQVEEELFGGPDIWCPLLSFYKHDHAEARRAEGEQFWWYICTGPKQPFLGLFTDHPGTDLRVWLWLTWKYDIDGILIWQSNYWSSSTAYPDHLQNPYEDPMSWLTGYGSKVGDKKAWGNGDGRFLYPPEAAADARPEEPVLAGPVDSIRWEMLRDGIEDYECFVILKRLLEEQARTLSDKELRLYRRLLSVPERIAASPKEYTKDPAPLERQRHRIAEVIEKLWVD
ncbi:MAG: DUF4091 domain-containing protein [Candidatus Hydrogenedens sp.]|nr:DUF4091 domain-containing protein [Candidatus Hydrogenedens sp.]